MPDPAPQHQSRLLRSAPVRLAVALVAVFAVVNALSLGAAYLHLTRQAEAELRASLAAQVASLSIPATSGAIATLVSAQAAATDPAIRVVVYVEPGGRQTGNAAIRLEASGPVIGARTDGRPLSPAGYVLRSERIAGGVLVVAESRQPIARLRETFGTLLLVSVLPTLALSLLAALVIAARTRRRVEAIAATLERIEAGDLSARVGGVRGPHDDLGLIAGGVNRMAAAQQGAADALRRVTADIAHDLRTPLHRIAVLLSDIVDRSDPESETARLADRAQAEASAAVQMFEGLLQIARIEGGAHLQTAPVDLAAVAATVAELFETEAEATGHRLILEPPPGPVATTGHRALIAQALSNLVRNALVHTPPGTAVRLGARMVEGVPALVVADAGPGIAEAEREAVLRPLYRLDRSRSSPGHGLGLSLAASVVRHHGGDIALEDAGPGLRVTLWFPPRGEGLDPDVATVRSVPRHG